MLQSKMELHLLNINVNISVIVRELQHPATEREQLTEIDRISLHLTHFNNSTLKAGRAGGLRNTKFSVFVKIFVVSSFYP